MKSHRPKSNLILLALLSATQAIAGSWGSPLIPAEQVLETMETELQRSLKLLRQDDFGPPYYLAYRLHDTRQYNVTATLGSIVGEETEEFHTAYVEARYGDRSFDNTDLNYQGVNTYGPTDPAILQQTFWNLTDQAYKGALSSWLEKRAKRATELITDPLDDFSPSPAQVKINSISKPSLEPSKLRSFVISLSRLFVDYQYIYESNASVSASWDRQFILTSEGTKLLTPGESMPHNLRLSAATRANDGMKLDNSMSWTIGSFSDLPPMAELEKRAKQLANELTEMRESPVQEATTAPAILDPEMSGVLFHESLGHKLEGQRQRDPHESQIFRDLVGKQIIPSFISLYDDPTMKTFKGEQLHGSYEFDSEGSPSQRVVLVEKGILRNFLMSRWPVKGFSQTNGHGRADWRSHPTGRMANLIVHAEKTVTVEELQKKLIDLLREQGKPYGFILMGSSGGENPTNRESAQTLEVRPRLIYRVEAATGKKTMVRGVKLVGTPLVILNRIVAAANDATLANAFHCGAESGWVPVSQIAPSLLLSGIELQRLPDDRMRPPILPSPLHGVLGKNAP